MSEHGGSRSPGAPPKADDPVTVLAKDIFSRLAAATFAGGKASEADAKELAELSLRLAAAFIQTWDEANAEALAAERRRPSFSADDLDSDSLLEEVAGPLGAGRRPFEGRKIVGAWAAPQQMETALIGGVIGERIAAALRRPYARAGARKKTAASGPRVSPRRPAIRRPRTPAPSELRLRGDDARQRPQGDGSPSPRAQTAAPIARRRAATPPVPRYGAGAPPRLSKCAA